MRSYYRLLAAGLAALGMCVVVAPAEAQRMRHVTIPIPPQFQFRPFVVQSPIAALAAAAQGSPRLAHELIPAINAALQPSTFPLAAASMNNAHRFNERLMVHQTLPQHGSDRRLVERLSIHTNPMHRPILREPVFRQPKLIEPTFVSGLGSGPATTTTPVSAVSAVPSTSSAVPAAMTPSMSNPYTTYSVSPGYGGSGSYGGNPMPYGVGGSTYGANQTLADTYASGATSPYSTPTAMAAAPTAPVNAVLIYDGFFQPTQITVPVGGTVKWTNLGTHRHTVASDNGQWDSGNIEPGGTFSHTFTQAGTFPYHCRIHPNMSAVVVVQ